MDAEETEEEAARLHGSGAGRGILSLATRRVVSWNRPGVELTVECLLCAVALRRHAAANQMPFSPGADWGRAGGDLSGHCFRAVAAIDRPHPEPLAIDSEPRAPTQRRSDSLSGRRGGQASLEEGTASETMPPGVPSPTVPGGGREAAGGVGAATDYGLAEADVSWR